MEGAGVEAGVGVLVLQGEAVQTILKVMEEEDLSLDLHLVSFYSV